MKVYAEALYKRNHDLEPAILSTPEDVDKMIDDLLSGSEHFNAGQILSTERERLPSGSYDHELLVGVDAELGLGAIMLNEPSGNYVTVGERGSRTDPVYFIMGYATEFPEECEIPIGLVREAVKEFVFEGGNRPRCVAWKEW